MYKGYTNFLEEALTYLPVQSPRAALGEQLWATATVVKLRAGRTLVALGASSDTVFVVIEGRLQAVLFSLSGREVILRDLGANDLFGDLAAIDGEPRSASIVALTTCVLASFPAAAFRATAIERPDTALWLLQRLARQIRSLTEKVFELNVMRVPARLHCELLRLGCVAGGVGATAIIEPAPTHAEFAARIGTHREAVTREMGFLTERRILSQQRRRIIVSDMAGLAGLVREASGNLFGEPRRA